MVTDKQRLEYYKNKGKVDRAVLKNVKRKGHIVYGARAVNKQLRKPLEKTTEDYDIFSKTPKKTAKRIERRIDKRYGFNLAETKPALHPGTTKVVNRVTKRGIADVSKTPKPSPRIVKRKGVKYAHTSHQLKQIKKSLSDPESKFRHDKDKETLKRIKLNEKLKAKKRRKKRSGGFIEQSKKIGVGNIKFMSPRF